MTTGMRLVLRLVGSASLLVACVSAAPRQKAVSPETASATVRATPEVRLRKLHLVRPDLIPYPVAYEVYC